MRGSERLLEETERQAHGKLFKDGLWAMDYRRLWIVARAAYCRERGEMGYRVRVPALRDELK